MSEKPRTRWADLANSPTANGFPTEESRQTLLDELYFQRAVQVYLSGMPAVNMLAIRDGSESKFGAGYHILPVWKKRMNAKAIIPTPNGDVIYAQSYLNLKKDGPLVVVAPPGLIGMFTDFWQRALTDVGIGGPDKGQGGVYLLVPPDYEGTIPNGYHTFRSPTYNVFLFWRAPMKKGAKGPDPTESVAHIEQTLVYPLRSAIPSQWKKMKFPDASGIPLNMMYPRDATFYDLLAKFIDYEPVASVDPFLRGMMASIGIIKGQSFKPDGRHREILETAARAGHKIATALIVSNEGAGKFYYPGKRQWFNGYAGADDLFFGDSYLNLDVQTAFFTGAYSSAPYMNVNAPGFGARYPSTFKDADGNYLVGGNTYRLHLAADVPAALFWSITAYIPEDGRMVDAGQPFPSINSMNDVAKNADGSFDLYFGPKLPAGKPETNWLKTNPGEGFMLSLRLYGATMPFYNQTWIPDDVVRVK